MCFYQNAVFLGLHTNIGMGCWEFKSEALQLTPKTSKMFQVCITGRERLPADSALLFACEIKVKVFKMCGSKKRGKKILKIKDGQIQNFPVAVQCCYHGLSSIPELFTAQYRIIQVTCTSWRFFSSV